MHEKDNDNASSDESVRPDAVSDPASGTPAESVSDTTGIPRSGNPCPPDQNKAETVAAADAMPWGLSIPRPTITFLGTRFGSQVEVRFSDISGSQEFLTCLRNGSIRGVRTSSGQDE